MMLESLFAPFVGEFLAKILDLLLGNGLFAVGVPMLLNWAIQSQRVPFINEYSSKITKVCAAIVAAAAAAGIKSSFDVGVGTYVVSGLTATGLGAFALEMVKQLGLQQLAFSWFLKKKFV